MSFTDDELKSTPIAELEAMHPHDLVVKVHTLETQRRLWCRRVALWEKRCDGLEELLAEVIRMMAAIFNKQRSELSRLAEIATVAAERCSNRVDELEELCDLSDDGSETGSNT